MVAAGMSMLQALRLEFVSMLRGVGMDPGGNLYIDVICDTCGIPMGAITVNTIKPGDYIPCNTTHYCEKHD